MLLFSKNDQSQKKLYNTKTPFPVNQVKFRRRAKQKEQPRLFPKLCYRLRVNMYSPFSLCLIFNYFLIRSREHPQKKTQRKSGIVGRRWTDPRGAEFLFFITCQKRGNLTVVYGSNICTQPATRPGAAGSQTERRKPS